MRDLTSIAPHRRQTLMCFTKPGTRHNRSLVTDRSICSFFVLLFPARMVKNKFRTFLAHALFRLLAQTGAPQGRRNAPGRMAPRHGSWLTRCSECWRRRALRKGGATRRVAWLPDMVPGSRDVPNAGADGRSARAVPGPASRRLAGPCAHAFRQNAQTRESCTRANAFFTIIP
jgi:hypothetical protein